MKKMSLEDIFIDDSEEKLADVDSTPAYSFQVVREQQARLP